MQASDLMRTEVFSVREDDSVETLMDALVGEHIHGAPVLDSAGGLVGVVTQQDVFFAAMTRGRDGEASAVRPEAVKVRSIMTAPAVSASEDTDIRSLCRMMHRLRIHRVPIVREDKVLGIISSLDICNALATGRLTASE